MIQVDVFWSFAMGASLATLAGERLKKEDSLIVNRYFVFIVCYLSMIFSPSGIYLLWQHTGWETMFFFGFDDLHGLFPCLFACTNVLLGVFGFVLCALLVRRNKETTAHACWTTSYTCMFSVLTFGYERSLYAGQSRYQRLYYPDRYLITDKLCERLKYSCIYQIHYLVN